MPSDEQSLAQETAHEGPSSDSDDVLLNIGTGLSAYTSGTDTITITSIDTSQSMSTITLPSYNYNISGASYTSNSGLSWSTISPSSSTVNIDTDGIDIKNGGDIKVDGRSLKEFMDKMEQRLAILVPNPEKLEKFEALKKAYEHYKTMEALCFPNDKEEKEK